MFSKNLLIFTDLGDDIDDSLAISYLVKHTQHHICGIVLSHGDISHRYAEAIALNQHLGRPLPRIRGSSTSFYHDQNFPAQTQEYITHALLGCEKFTVLCLCAATDLAKSLLHIPDFKNRIERICYQGQIVDEAGRYLANTNSYNFRTDPEAIRYCLQSKIPFTTITKTQAYAHPFREIDFLKFSGSRTLNEYLLKKAYEWQTRFKQLDPLKHAEIYGHDSTILSYPYDLLVAKSV